MMPCDMFTHVRILISSIRETHGLKKNNKKKDPAFFAVDYKITHLLMNLSN